MAREVEQKNKNGVSKKVKDSGYKDFSGVGKMFTAAERPGTIYLVNVHWI